MDHKTHKEVAVKINKNMTTHHNTCRAEASIMSRLRDAISDEEEIITSLRLYKNKIVHFVESFLFRNHYVNKLFFNSYVVFCFWTPWQESVLWYKRKQFWGFQDW